MWFHGFGREIMKQFYYKQVNHFVPLKAYWREKNLTGRKHTLDIDLVPTFETIKEAI
jgi:hypothetical protein